VIARCLLGALRTTLQMNTSASNQGDSMPIQFKAPLPLAGVCCCLPCRWDMSDNLY
jgi:hypothetical protein